MTTQEFIEAKREELSNAIFPSKECEGIEHVDMSYEGLFNWLETYTTELVAIVRKETEDEANKQFAEWVEKRIPVLLQDSIDNLTKHT